LFEYSNCFNLDMNVWCYIVNFSSKKL